MIGPVNNRPRLPYTMMYNKRTDMYEVVDSVGAVIATYRDQMDAKVYISLKHGHLAMVPTEYFRKMVRSVV